VRLLIDAGMSRSDIATRLESIGEDPDGIDAVLITHEHSDHAGGLKSLLKDLPIDAFLTAGTLAALGVGGPVRREEAAKRCTELNWTREAQARQGAAEKNGPTPENEVDQLELSGSKVIPIQAGVSFQIGDAEIHPFRVPHDSTEPVAFSVTCNGIKITQLTDVGHLPEDVVARLTGSQVLILESNHDLEMLRIGPYPWNLKQRLIGRYGHLSNTAVSRFIREQYDGMAEHVLLAHLSSKNNHPEIARQEATRALRERGLSTAPLALTSQDEPTVPIRL